MMTRFTPVLPAALHSLLDVASPGSWHFLHAPQVVGPYGPSIIKGWGGCEGRVILDCFAYENSGDELDITAVYEAATLLRDSDLIIICPDVPHNYATTFQLLRQHGPALAGYGRLMIVPHGKDMVEWMLCVEYMTDFVRSMGIPTPFIGLPRYMTDWGRESREHAAIWLSTYLPTYPLHLLGAGMGLDEVMRVAAWHVVTSCDSTCPFAYALAEGVYTDYLAKVEMKPEWWDMKRESISPEVLRTVQLNIALWRHEVQEAS